MPRPCFCVKASRQNIQTYPFPVAHQRGEGTCLSQECTECCIGVSGAWPAPSRSPDDSTRRMHCSSTSLVAIYRGLGDACRFVNHRDVVRVCRATLQHLSLHFSSQRCLLFFSIVCTQVAQKTVSTMLNGKAVPEGELYLARKAGFGNLADIVDRLNVCFRPVSKNGEGKGMPLSLYQTQVSRN